MTETVMRSPVARVALLHRALQVDALFSGACGVICVLAAAPLTTLTGCGPAGVFQGLGIFLLTWAGTLFYGTTRPPVPTRLGWIVVAGNSLWVLASIGLLLTGRLPLTTAGLWLMVAQAVIVTGVADAQLVGLWRLRRA